MPDLHDRIDSLFGDEPPHRPIDVQLASGHRALRRRRVGSSVGALAVLAIVGGTGYVAQAGSGDDSRGDDPVATSTPSVTPPADPDADLLAQCRTGQPADDAGYLWSGGAAEAMATIDTWDGWTKAYLRSADQKFWGTCSVSAEDEVYVDAYRIAPDVEVSNLGYGYGIGDACEGGGDVDPSCRKFVATHEGRRDPAVARVEVRFMDGQWEKVDTIEGYYFIEHVGTLPADITWGKDGMPLRNGDQIDDVINRIRLLDDGGKLIAFWDSSQNRNGLNAANDKGVAELEAYPMIQSRPAGPDGDREFP